jgi:hypothetical protein
MTPISETPARAGDAATGAGRSLLEDRNVQENSQWVLKSQAQNRPASPIIIASHCRLTSDLLAESVEIAMSYGVAILAAAREADDGAILAQFKGFDAATRTARRCAEELRGAFALLDPGGAQ